RRAGHEVRGFPALTDEGSTVGLGVFGSEEEAAARHRLGVRRLLLLALPSAEPLLAGLSNTDKLALAVSPYPTVTEMVEDLRAAVLIDVVDAHPRVRDQGAYEALLTTARTVLERSLPGTLADLMKTLAAWRSAEKVLTG